MVRGCPRPCRRLDFRVPTDPTGLNRGPRVGAPRSPHRRGAHRRPAAVARGPVKAHGVLRTRASARRARKQGGAPRWQGERLDGNKVCGETFTVSEASPSRAAVARSRSKAQAADSEQKCARCSRRGVPSDGKQSGWTEKKLR